MKFDKAAVFGGKNDSKKRDTPSNLPPQPASSIWERLTKFYIIPEGRYIMRWDQSMVVVSLLNISLITFSAAFQLHTAPMFIVAYLVDLLYLIDIYLRMHHAYLQNSLWVVFPKEMLEHYVSSKEFILDVLFNLPVDIIATASLDDDPLHTLALIRLWKIPRSIRMLTFFRRQERKLHAGFSIQVIKFVCIMFTITHTLSCIWFAIACHGRIQWDTVTPLVQACSSVSWFSSFVTSDINDAYVLSIYWAVTTTTTTGYGEIRPSVNGERLFAMFTMTIGILFYGYVSGTVASTLSNMDSRRVAYSQQLDAIKQYMADRDMDQDMQQRVLTYYDYSWERNRGVDVKDMFAELPTTFKCDVAINLNNSIIDNAKIFADCSVGFRRKIATAMRMYLFTANEYIVHKGDLGLEMFFITQGRVDVYASEDIRKPIASLIEGGHFGEDCIVLGKRHETSARAVCNTDIYVLSSRDLLEAFNAFPHDMEVVTAATRAQNEIKRQSKKSRLAHHQSLDDDDDLSAGPPNVYNSKIKGSTHLHTHHMGSGYLIMDKESARSRSQLNKCKSSDTSTTSLSPPKDKSSRVGSIFSLNKSHKAVILTEENENVESDGNNQNIRRQHANAESHEQDRSGSTEPIENTAPMGDESV